MHVCDICEMNFSNEHSLVQHKNIHTIEEANSLEKYQCTICKKSYPQKYALKKHMRNHHSCLFKVLMKTPVSTTIGDEKNEMEF